jgi:preprotein translocase subunit YajC
MDVLISTAYAQAPAGVGDAGIMGFLPIILMFVLLYFIMIRPQMKRQKETKAMIEALQKGDEVVTAGGVVGKVAHIAENYVTLEIAENTQILVQKAAVTLTLPKGSIKAMK